MKRLLASLFASAASMMVVLPATAAGTGNSTTAASTEGIETVVVTAEKRTERLQDVPLSVSAISELGLQRQGITRFTELISQTPGLHLSEDPTQSTFTVRGISSSSTADTTSATAGVYVDDFPLYDTWFRFASPDIPTYDIGRIEVLRGPQGTLYGATSLSGSVRIITNKPDLYDFSAEIEGTGNWTEGGGGGYAANGMINLPLIDGKLGVRAVAYSSEDGGYIDNPVRGQSNVNGKRDYGGRFYISARPTEDWSILASFMYQRDTSNDASSTYYFPPPGQNTSEINSVLPTIIRSEIATGSLVVDKYFGANDLNLTLTYGYDSSDNVGDGTPISVALGVPVATQYFQPSVAHSITAEARYTSDASLPFRYMLGIYYNTRGRTLMQNDNQPALAPYWGTDSVYNVWADQRATEMAAFGDVTWAFAPKWEVTAGLRVFNNNYTFNSVVSGLLNNLFDPLTPSVTHVKSKNSSETPRVSLSYKPEDNLNFYATISEGYRFGLSNYNSGTGVGIPLIYKPDTLWNYEVGAKITFLDGRASLNSSLYYESWLAIQTSFRNPISLQVYITNAGNARSYGFENELVFKPDPAWEFNAALTLGRAELTTDNVGILARAASIRGPAIYGVLAGEQLPGSQTISASGGVQYNILDVMGGNAYIRFDDSYVGSSYVDFLHTGSLKIGDYNLSSLRVGYTMDRYDVVVFADNLFNSHGVENAVPDADITGLTDWAFRVRPRTIGLTLRAHI